MTGESGKKHFRFLDWPVYRDSKTLYKKILSITQSLPNKYQFNIGEQVRRSSLSISLNIAEGCGKHSDKDFNRFLNTALGSLNETVAAIDILQTNNLLKEGDFENILELCTSISNQLGGLKKKLV